MKSNAPQIDQLDDAEWHVFTGSKYDAGSDEWQMTKLPVHHIVA